MFSAAVSDAAVELSRPTYREYPAAEVTYEVMVSMLRDLDSHIAELNNRLSPPMEWELARPFRVAWAFYTPHYRGGRKIIMILNFGLKWERRCIEWGGRGAGNAGSLKGVGPSTAAAGKQSTVDFRDQVGIYILYDDHEAIYVGQTGAKQQRLFSRLKQHTCDHLSDRWDRFSWFGFRSVNKGGGLREGDGNLTRQIDGAKTLDLIEGLLIQCLEPHLNKQGPRWSGIDQYSQRRSVTGESSDRELLEKILLRLDQKT